MSKEDEQHEYTPSERRSIAWYHRETIYGWRIKALFVDPRFHEFRSRAIRKTMHELFSYLRTIICREEDNFL